MGTQQQHSVFYRQRHEYFTRFTVTDDHIKLLSSIEFIGGDDVQQVQVQDHPENCTDDEIVVVFQIAMHNGIIEPGDYERETWLDKWQRVQEER